VSTSRLSEPAVSSPENLAGSPGAVLRRCREFHGITLEEASETTKIGISHLKALENDQIRVFANQAYLKGFLRIYATFLGLNSDDVARMYDKLFGVQSEKPDSARTPPTPTKPPRRLISFKKMILPAFLLALILITAIFFKRPPVPPARQPQPTMVVVPSSLNSALHISQSSARNKRVGQDIPSSKPERRSAELPDPEKTVTLKRVVDTAKGFILKIKVTQNGTLTATVDGSGAQQYELTIGDVIEWKADKKVTLELSNAGGVDVELNGKPYKSFGLPGKSAYVELDAGGVKQ
jgi:cytoskeletal protein RodZ